MNTLNLDLREEELYLSCLSYTSFILELNDFLYLIIKKKIGVNYNDKVKR